MKKFLIVSVVALAAVSVAVTAAVAKPAKKSATHGGLRPAAGHQVVRPLGAVRQARTSPRRSRPPASRYSITNALNDAQKQIAQADQCLANGAKVAVITSLDTGSSIAIQKKFAAAGGQSIDYDRQIVGGTAKVYVTVRRQRRRSRAGHGARRRSARAKTKPVVAQLWGGKTDQNAFWFQSGNNDILNPLFATKKLTRGPQQFVPGWLATNAQPIFEQMLLKTSNKIDGVIAANDNIAGAVVATLKAKGLPYIPLTGQDATVQGVQNIISGRQTMTVYKYVPAEANAAAARCRRPAQGQEAEDERDPAERRRPGADVRHPGDLDHQGQLQASLHGQVPEEERRLRRRVREVLRQARASAQAACVAEARDPSSRESPATQATPGSQSTTDSHDHHNTHHDTSARDPRPVEELRLGPCAHRRRLRGAKRGSDGARRRQRRRQVDADQVRRRHPRLRPRRDRLRRQAGEHPRPEGRREARDRGRLPGSRAVRQPRRRPEHVPRPRDARPALASQRARDGAAHARDAAVALRHHDPLRPSARRLALGRPAPVGGGGEGRAVELAPRHPRRADRRARRRPDAPGARPRQAPRRQGARGRAHLAQPPRHLRGRHRITVLRLGRDIAVYERDKTTQQEVVHAITAGVPTKVAGIAETAPELAS